MRFRFSEHNTTGFLNGDDLNFFYYDIGLDNLQGWPLAYDWNSIIKEFSGLLDIKKCEAHDIPKEFVLNTIRFTVSNNPIVDNDSVAAAFFRHLRNAFSHYSIVREGENYILTDGKHSTTMRGLVNAELLKKFCYRFFDMREAYISKYEQSPK